MAMMEVVMIDTFGSREVMKFRKIPIPTPGPNEILLKVKAAGINPVDWKIREGLYPHGQIRQAALRAGQRCIRRGGGSWLGNKRAPHG
jgi:NADPH:quinone reductase-like Zn-dependent oxidoreductase